MSVDSKCILCDVKTSDVVKALKYVCDEVNLIKQDPDDFYFEKNYINITNKNHTRNIYYLNMNKKVKYTFKGEERTCDNIKDYPFIKNKIKKTLVWMSLGCNEQSIFLFSYLAKIFDGWFLDDDCIHNKYTKTNSEDRKKMILYVFDNII